MNIHDITALIGFLAILVGFGAALKPKIMSKKFGIDASAEALPYVMSTGLRDVFIGITLLILYFQQQWLSLGYVYLGLSFVALGDFLIVFSRGDRKTSCVHLLGSVVCIGLATWFIKTR